MSKKENRAFALKFFKISLIFFFIISILATQYFAFSVKYNNSLGGFKILNIPHKVYFPFAYFFWQKKYIKNVPKLIGEINWYIFIFTGIYLIITLVILKKKNESTVHGSARWASNNEIKKMELYKPTGVVLGCDPKGNLLHDNSDRHLAFFAPTRMGKGINSVTPTCYDWINSIVINDIKGELWGLTAGYRKEVLGQKVFMFCPIDTEGISCSINNLDFIEIGTKNEMKDVSIVSQTLIDVEGKGDSDHWITSAINLLNGVILHVKYAIPNASLVDVIEFISPTTGSLSDRLADILGVPREDEEDETGVALRSGCSEHEISYNKKGEQNYPTKGYAAFNHLEYYEDKELFKKIYKYEGTELDKEGKLHPIVAKEFMTLYKTPDKERGSIISTATQKLKIFMDPLIAEHIRHSDFTIQQLKDERCSLYLVTPPDSIKRTQSLLRLTFTQIVFKLTNRMTFDIHKKEKKNFLQKINEKIEKKVKDYFYPEVKEEKNRILLLIDEFPSLGKLDVIEQSMSYIAGYGLKTFLISQSLGQFRKIYGKDNYILDNCSIQLYLTPNDPDTPKMLSDKLGKYTVKTESYSKKGFELTPTKSISYVGRALMTPEEIGTLPYEEILLLITGQKPIKGEKLFYYKDDRYIEKLMPAPNISDKNRNITTSSTIESEKRKENLREKIKDTEKWVILTDNLELDYDKELEAIEKNYEITSKLTYEELLNNKFELAYKYSLLNKENIENAKNKFFKTENIEKIKEITNNSLDRTNELIMES